MSDELITAGEHRITAEKLIEEVVEAFSDDSPSPASRNQWAKIHLAMAQVHATLALAMVTANIAMYAEAGQDPWAE